MHVLENEVRGGVDISATKNLKPPQTVPLVLVRFGRQSVWPP